MRYDTDPAVHSAELPNDAPAPVVAISSWRRRLLALIAALALVLVASLGVGQVLAHLPQPAGTPLVTNTPTISGSQLESGAPLPVIATQTSVLATPTVPAQGGGVPVSHTPTPTPARPTATVSQPTVTSTPGGGRGG